MRVGACRIVSERDQDQEQEEAWGIPLQGFLAVNPLGAA